jgi:hypothetical protein
VVVTWAARGAVPRVKAMPARVLRCCGTVSSSESAAMTKAGGERATGLVMPRMVI